MNNYLSSISVAWVLIAWMAGSVQAGGLYVSGELGMNFGKSLDTDGHDTDRASACDEYINPMFATVTQNARVRGLQLHGSESWLRQRLGK